MNIRGFQGASEQGPGRYIFAVLATIGAMALRGSLDPVLGAYVPYLAVLPAVVLSAWYCGLGPSVLTTVLCFLGEQYWFIPPYRSLAIAGGAELAGTLVYFLVSALVVALAELNRRATATLAVSKQNLEQASEALRKSHEELEWRVRERTRELQEKNTELVNQTETVRDLSGRLLQMQDEERRRIARALHDSLGQLNLLGWGAAVIGQIDSLVRPYVISERAKLHTLLVFFALLGGVKAFGVMGLFIGPVVLSVTLVVLEMLREANLDHPTA
ncbi:MAG: hypothetical protein DMG69_05035 [Acidobacteria bacterium]|nr:MAG: hypothetical protein DMG69_05035 [Acidobacteriota bacterium]